jgi:rhodanese-related sulfurtransferase
MNMSKGKTTMKRMALTITLLLLLPLAAHAAKWEEITPQQVYTLQREGSGLWLIDVRGPQPFEAVHIEGAVNIPQAALAVKRFPKEKILVVADNSLGQQQAREAADQLVKNGQKRVYVLAGGIAAWEQAKLPLVGDGQDWSLRQVRPAELAQARKLKVKIELFDLREGEDFLKNPLPDASVIPGKTLEIRLEKLVKLLEKQYRKGLGGKLKQQPVSVVVLPAAADAHTIYLQHLRRISGDVRVLDGAYLVPRKGERETVTSGSGCPTCPGGE